MAMESKVKFTTQIREAIWERSGGRCEMCGTPAANGQIHHRRPRGMGGSKDPLTGAITNGVLLHPNCHAKVESERSWAFDNGWLVQQRDEPELTPIMTWRGYLWLTPDGSYMDVLPDVNESANDDLSKRIPYPKVRRLRSDESLD